VRILLDVAGAVRRHFTRRERRLWHPESPGVYVRIQRAPIEEHFKPHRFATTGEVLRMYKTRLN
jgi:hypothetical protein